MPILRCFIAIELPEPVKSALSALQQDLKEGGADIRWVKPDNIHLTLKFLGDVDGNNVGNIVKQIEGACADYSFFDLDISGIGVFPDTRSPRILWAGVKSGDTLAEIYRAIDDAMAVLGFVPEKRKFNPHLTLGRFRSFKGKGVLAQMLEQHKNRQVGEIHVRTIALMKSELKSSGAEYSRLAEVPLNAGRG